RIDGGVALGRSFDGGLRRHRALCWLELDRDVAVELELGLEAGLKICSASGADRRVDLSQLGVDVAADEVGFGVDIDDGAEEGVDVGDARDGGVALRDALVRA